MMNNVVNSLIKSSTGYILLMIASIGDLMLPFLFAPFCKNYNHLTMVMSLLGNPNSPVHIIYSIWLITAGIMLILGALTLYTIFVSISSVLSKILLVCIVLFAVGACILSGIFPVEETKELSTLSAKIHGVGSVLGFFALLFVPLIIGLISLHSNEIIYGIISIIFFILAILFFSFFAMSDKETFSDTIIANEGLWQRLNLLCMYAPLVMISMKNLLSHEIE